MRNRLIKLLKELEGSKISRSEYLFEIPEEYQSISEDPLVFPDYGFIIKKYDDKYPVYSPDGIFELSWKNEIMFELKRMELDGLIVIGTQKTFPVIETKNGSSFSYDVTEELTESIVLTTKGKSGWEYFKNKATENPVTLILSLIAIIISIISLFK